MGMTSIGLLWVGPASRRSVPKRTGVPPVGPEKDRRPAGPTGCRHSGAGSACWWFDRGIPLCPGWHPTQKCLPPGAVRL